MASTPTGTCASSVLQPISLPVMNSLVSTNKVVVDHTLVSSVAPAVLPAAAPPTPVGAVPVIVPVVPPAAVIQPAAAIAAVTSAVAPVSGVTAAAAAVAAVAAGDEDTPMAPVVAAASQIAAGLAGTGNPTLVVQPPPAPPIVPVPHDIIPGPTYHEPMDCQVNADGTEGPASSVVLRPASAGGPSSGVSPKGPSANTDVPMESLTNPPTPASTTTMQTDAAEPSMQKSESTTMLCDENPPSPLQSPSGHSPNPALPLPAAEDGGDRHPVVPVVGDNITNNPEVTTMLCDEMVSTDLKEVANPSMTIKDLVLLCQLFYLPSDHGRIGLALLEDFFWLKRCATTMLPPGSPGAGSLDERREWEKRAAKFKQNVTDIQMLFVKLCSCQNRWGGERFLRIFSGSFLELAFSGSWCTTCTRTCGTCAAWCRRWRGSSSG